MKNLITIAAIWRDGFLEGELRHKIVSSSSPSPNRIRSSLPAAE